MADPDMGANRELNSRRKKRGLLPVVIMGAGRLGESLLTLGSFSLSGFTIVGVFDKDPKRIGVRLVTSSCGTHVVEPTVKLASRVHTLKVRRGIIAVPSSTAQEAADELVGAGINFILSYAPTDIRVPSDVIYSRVDPATQFARMVPQPRFPWRSVTAQTKIYQPRFNSSTMSEDAGVSHSIGLARLPSMWTSLGSNSIVINPVLLTLVSSETSLGEDDVDIEQDEDTSTVTTYLSSEEEPLEPPGFFEFIQSNQRFFVSQQKPLVVNSKQILVGMESHLTAIKETLLMKDDLVRIRGTLLYGPSGCGKSTLTKQIAMQLCDVTFFFVSGEEESLISAFRAAANGDVGSAVVVIENIDVLCRKRAFKSAFLSCTDNPLFNSVSIIGSTNAPWELDTSVLRHFERRTFVPLPDTDVRAAVLKKHFAGCTIADKLTDADFAFVGRTLDGYSTSDVITVAKNAGLNALKSGDSLSRADLCRGANLIRPTFCAEVLPLFQSFSERFGTNLSSPQRRQFSTESSRNDAYLSMYS